MYVIIICRMFKTFPRNAYMYIPSVLFLCRSVSVEGNDYLHRKWIRCTEFIWPSILFLLLHIIVLGKSINPTSHIFELNIRAYWSLLLWICNQSRRKNISKPFQRGTDSARLFYLRHTTVTLNTEHVLRV